MGEAARFDMFGIPGANSFLQGAVPVGVLASVYGAHLSLTGHGG